MYEHVVRRQCDPHNSRPSSRLTTVNRSIPAVRTGGQNGWPVQLVTNCESWSFGLSGGGTRGVFTSPWEETKPWISHLGHLSPPLSSISITWRTYVLPTWIKGTSPRAVEGCPGLHFHANGAGGRACEQTSDPTKADLLDSLMLLLSQV